MSVEYCKFPAPYYGGKQHAAPTIWAALGDPVHYAEPFCGSLATLLRRPAVANRTYHSETVNDVDGLLVNALRSIQLHPDETADAASWPVSEADLHARHLALVRWRTETELEHLMGDPTWCNPVMGGWWLWGQSSFIGSGWCSGKGAWVLGAGGRIERGQGGIYRKLPHLGDDGKGVNRPQLRQDGVGDEPEFHDMTMPELRSWMRFLSARLRHVRILNGDWKRLATSGALKILNVRQKQGVCGIMLDPPYADTAGRCADLYTNDSLTVAHDVREWCLANGDDPQYRIVLAGFEGEHVMPESWLPVEWYAPGFLRGGMSNVAGSGSDQQKRERLWLSPHCIRPMVARQGSLSL